jgi:gamma-glutamyltranspeptidase/glutathione hydrolase
MPGRPRHLIARLLAPLAALCLVLASPCGDAASATERVPGRAAIASAHPLASQAGHEILEQGGNAFDAAIAVAAALSVVEPNASGLGGGGFLLLHRASDGLDTMIDARETAPGAARRNMFLDAAGEPVKGLSTDTGLAGGIPGEPAGLALLAAKYGRLALARDLAPAIRLAREGFPVYARLQGGLHFKLDAFRRQREVAQRWLERGEIPPIGFRVRQPELARTLETFARAGADGFYHGALARKLVAGVHALGGIWTEEDLAHYTALERAPLTGTYRGARIVSGSPPTSGGVVLIDALNILSAYDRAALGPVNSKHVVIEAMRRAHRDRAVWLGDPDFVKAPIEMLVSPWYAAGQRAALSLEHATPSALLPGIADAPPGQHTTHFSILDKDGNRVAATLTINTWFGTGLVIPGTGVFLNNEMDDFSVKPGVPNAYQLVGAEANAIAPGKRPLSSSTPTFIEAPRGVMILGSPGGSYIPGTVLLGTLAFLDGHGAREIVSAPRFHHQYLPDVVQFEPDAISDEERAQLERMGHKLVAARGRWGNLQVVTWDYASGVVEAASDPRGAGEGMVY